MFLPLPWRVIRCHIMYRMRLSNRNGTLCIEQEVKSNVEKAVGSNHFLKAG